MPTSADPLFPPPGPALEQRSARMLWLSDGRRLGYAEFGDRNGNTAFFFHGAPGSRLSGDLLDASARSTGVRLIALDRPGFGLSSFQPGRDRLEWSVDVLEVADLLGIERFLVIGWSAGGPYALACAAAAPARVRAAGVMAGVDRLQHLNPRLVKTLWGLRSLGRDPDRWSDAIARAWTRTQRAAGGTGDVPPGTVAAIAAGIREGLREGTAGVLHELRLLSRAWDFDPSIIRDVPVRFWHGLDDALISTRHTRTLTARVPGAQASYLPGCGHVTLLTRHGHEMLSELQRVAT